MVIERVKKVQEGQKSMKKDIFGPSLTSWLLGVLKNHSKILKLLTLWPHVSHLNIKFAHDPADPAQLIALRNWANYGILGFFSEKNVLVHHQMTSYFFTLLAHFFAQFSSCSQAQSYLVWCRSEKEFRISKRIFTDRFQKSVLLATPSISFRN